jgi:hypothetical protein
MTVPRSPSKSAMTHSSLEGFSCPALSGIAASATRCATEGASATASSDGGVQPCDAGSSSRLPC